MNVTQLLLLELWVRVRNEPTDSLNMIETRTIFSKSCLKHFWNWNDFTSYIVFLTVMTTVLTGSMLLLHEYTLYVEFLGFFSTLTDAFLAFPQLVKNFQRKSVLGLSFAMVLMWFGGDLFKTGYFIVLKQPKQFVVCGIIQIIIDILIILQIIIYGKKTNQNQILELNNA